ncbi:MAG: nucleotidyltransferase [Stygiobacter sp.]|jgi:predicted nucleotidyltransferase|uniref:Nucleotidyltransferase n=1 Tax=Stygiobacter electus TaxID=3032292 RepID=A0AAE3TE40_9BACT|nr:nucleotidyltransferase [Stygiobacter electus]MDF1612077.1 nucleotidyltransferase [Stygiobacter electus]
MLTQDFKEFIRLLNEQKVEYIIVGGHAVIYHGYVRYTGDLDVWINNSNENADKMISVIEKFGFGSIGLTKKDFMEKDSIIQLGYEPDRIDIITSVEGLNFNDSYPRAIETEYDGEKIKLLSLEDLKINKKAAGRLQDLTDLEKLNRKKKK